MLKVPPHSRESEMSVLWALLIDSDYLLPVMNILKDFDFYENENSIIFAVMKKIFLENKKVDLITVKERLEKEKNLEKIGWITYLAELTEIVPTTANTLEYAEIIKEKSRLRKILKLSHILQTELFEEKKSTKIISEIYKFLPKIEKDFSENKKMTDIYEETYEYLENIKNTELVGISYWKEFKFLDEFTGWIQPWNIIRIWGWSNVWKTWLLLNFLLEVVEADGNVTFFSLENSANFTMKNIFWLKKWVNSLPENIKKHKIDFTSEALYFVEKENFYLDTESRSLEEIFRKTLKNKSKFIFIDYLQLVNVEWNSKNEKLTKYAFAIQEFAQKNGIVVFDLSQLSNEANRWWAEWYASTEFYGASELKASCDVWIHIFADNDKMKLREQCMLAWDYRDYFKNFVKIKISKNRLWAGVWSIKDFFIDFSKWWKFFNSENNL